MIYKKFLDLELSEIGIGTYLGNPDIQTDKNYEEAIKTAIELGVNVIDTAINYRNMRSERVIGKVIKNYDRKNLVISTKGGYFPTDVDLNITDITKYLKENFIDTGIISKEDITPYGNIISPKYIDWSFEKSLENLNTDYIDIYFLHNPEDQLQIIDKEKFYRKLWATFRLLEGKVKENKLRYYGIATWNGLKAKPTDKQYLNLKEIYDIAVEVGGENHHFRFIQLPYNVAMTEAYSLKNQEGNLSVLELAKKLNIYVYTSATLFQGRVIRQLPDITKQIFKVEKDIHVPIQFVRSTPNIGTALIGMSKKEHVIENLEIEKYPKLTPEEFEALFEKAKK